MGALLQQPQAQQQVQQQAQNLLQQLQQPPAPNLADTAGFFRALAEQFPTQKKKEEKPKRKKDSKKKAEPKSKRKDPFTFFDRVKKGEVK